MNVIYSIYTVYYTVYSTVKYHQLRIFTKNSLFFINIFYRQAQGKFNIVTARQRDNATMRQRNNATMRQRDNATMRVHWQEPVMSLLTV